MALTNAERQKRWRQRQKEKDYGSYLRKESERKKGKYVPTNQLSEKEKEMRRKKCREDTRKHYWRKKEQLKREKENKGETRDESSGRCLRSTSTNLKGNILKVKLPFSKGTAVKRRYRRALRKAYRDIDCLTEAFKKALRQKKNLQRQIQRRRKLETPSRDIQENNETNTPRSKTRFMLKKVGIQIQNKKAINDVRRKLEIGNAFVDKVKLLSQRKKSKSKQSFNIAVGADILRKYRSMALVSRETGLSRKRLSTMHHTRVSKSIREKYAEQVKIFLEREDNSTLLPGKRDVIMKKKEATQKRILNDYLHNLHEKFLLENPGSKLSRSSFSKMRPPNMFLTSFSSRKTCLCIYHQNFSLKIKSMQREGLKCSANPDVFIKEYESSQYLNNALSEVCANDKVKFRMWKKVPEEDKVRWREVEEIVPKQEFITTVTSEHEKFTAHVKRVQNQYSQMRKLRENLPENNILIWMDFAENYGCSSVEEVQSAYWNAPMVSLHTMVVYFPNTRHKTIQSYVAVSNVLNHNATVVYTILKKLVPQLREEFPNLQQIHYLTDSPSSQYRNKTIFNIICEHEIEFGVRARWDFLECGHGKGPCDGLGASVKRMADMAMTQEKCSIQDADEFYEWMNRQGSDSKVKYTKYTEEEVEISANELKNRSPIIAVPGTMKLHAVVPISKDTIAVRELSCYCQDCMNDVLNSKCGWESKRIVKKSDKTDRNNNTADQSTSNNPAEKEKEPDIQIEEQHSLELTKAVGGRSNKDMIQVKVNDWVAAVYDEKWYLGQITDVDTDDCQINFLENSGKYGKAFKFPMTKDEIWVQRQDILLVLREMQGVGKGKRFYKLSDEEEQMVIQKYVKYTEKKMF